MMLHCAMFSIIALVIFNVLRFTFQEKVIIKINRCQDLVSRMVTPVTWSITAYTLHQTFGIHTCAIALHCIMLIITYYIKS